MIKFFLTCFISTFIISFCAIGQETTIYNSPFSFEETEKKMEKIIADKGYAAEKYVSERYEYETDGQSKPIRVFEFTNDSTVQKIINCEPTSVLDMPFRIMLWKESDNVYIAYVDPVWLKRRYQIEQCVDALEDYHKLLIRIANETIRKN